MEQILLVHGLPIMILFQNTKVIVRSPDGDFDFFGIVTRILQGDTLATYLFILCLHYVLRTFIDLIKKKYFLYKNARSRRYPVEAMIDVDF